MTENEIAGANLFMMCEKLNSDALTDVPEGYTLRPLRPDELELWKVIHFDTAPEVEQNKAFMDQYYDTVYAPYADTFYNSCLVLCRNDTGEPIGTCFAWMAYQKVLTIHWFKIKKEYENHGLGRALLSGVMRTINPQSYPVFLHTQPSSYRAIKLYTDFGFSFLTDDKVGYRQNHLTESLPYLKARMPEKVYHSLTFKKAPSVFLDAALTKEFSEF